ncbi:aromatic ring-hydroxylating dioxygenase subunit alpha, partial [Burkholderia semiarida]
NPGDAEVTDRIREGQHKIFSEDLEMLELQQRNLSAHPDRKLLKLNIDAGSVQSRKVLDKWIAQEQQAAAVAAVAAAAATAVA